MVVAMQLHCSGMESGESEGASWRKEGRALSLFIHATQVLVRWSACEGMREPSCLWRLHVVKQWCFSKAFKLAQTSTESPNFSPI